MRLFLYGTLLAGQSRAAAPLHRKLAPGLPARVAGRLYALPDPGGWYPALYPDPQGPAALGMVHETAADFTAQDLAAIDSYEDFRPGDPAGSDYRRQFVTARILADGGRVEAEAYCYNRPLPPGAELIPGGDFAAWLQARGARPFGA